MFYNYILLSYTHTQIRGRERVYHIMIITCVSKKKRPAPSNPGETPGPACHGQGGGATAPSG